MLLLHPCVVLRYWFPFIWRPRSRFQSSTSTRSSTSTIPSPFLPSLSLCWLQDLKTSFPSVTNSSSDYVHIAVPLPLPLLFALKLTWRTREDLLLLHCPSSMSDTSSTASSVEIDSNKCKTLEQDLDDLYGDIPEPPKKKVFLPVIKSEPLDPIEEAEKLRVWYWNICNKCKHRQLITKFKQED